MCGLVGQVSIDKQVDSSWLANAIDSMKDRGPDEKGMWISEDKLIGLGHTRLSIIDLSRRSNQPMSSICGFIKIVFNGEIYNFNQLKNKLLKLGHRFKTNSDTEVIIECYKEWKEDFSKHLLGMFSIVLYDSRIKKVYLVRDRVGEKPLYYFFKNGNLIFSSKLNTIFENSLVDKKLCKGALINYLNYGYTPSNKSIVNNIKKLRPGHILIYNLSDKQIKISRFWNPPERDINQEYDLNEHVKNIHDLLKKAVESQMVSDVPIGVLLSGGLDSSLVTAFASKLKPNLDTFTVTLSGFENFDESRYAKKISEFYSTNHTLIPIEEISIDDLNQISDFIDEPIGDSSLIPTYLISKVISKNCKVAIGGDGSDEIFGGYKYYIRQKLHQKLFSFIPYSARSLVSKKAIKYLPCGLRGRNFLDILGDDYDSYPRQSNYFFDVFSINLLNKKLLNFEPLEIMTKEDKLKFENLSFFRKSMMQDFFSYLPENILLKTDRASMSQSLELRTPFLDYRLIEYVFKSLPDSLCCANKNRKVILKELGKNILPKDFNYDRKQGFSIPLSYFFSKEDFLDNIRNVLLDDKSIFKSRFTEDLLKSLNYKSFSNTERIYSLYLFELWRKKNKIMLYE